MVAGSSPARPTKHIRNPGSGSMCRLQKELVIELSPRLPMPIQTFCAARSGTAGDAYPHHLNHSDDTRGLTRFASPRKVLRTQCITHCGPRLSIHSTTGGRRCSLAPCTVASCRPHTPDDSRPARGTSRRCPVVGSLSDSQRPWRPHAAARSS